MTDAQLWSQWQTGLIVAAVIVVAAAALLIGIAWAARRILRLALEALEAVETIKANTQSIWALKDTNREATQILEAAESIRDHGALVAGALTSDETSNVA